MQEKSYYWNRQRAGDEEGAVDIWSGGVQGPVKRHRLRTVPKIRATIVDNVASDVDLDQMCSGHFVAQDAKRIDEELFWLFRKSSLKPRQPAGVTRRILETLNTKFK